MAEQATETTTAAPPPAVEKPIEKPKKESVHKADYEKDVVYLYQFVRTPVIPSPSPFCLKVETWLRMAEIKYENVDHKMKYKSKKGQLPFVELNGAEINDSEMIIKELGKHYNVDLDKDLDQNQRNISHAFISMLNNHTSWVCRWWRYSHPGEFIKGGQVDLKKTLNSKLPKGILNFLFKMGFKSNLKQAVGHGLGRNTEEEIISYGKSDLKVLSDYLADKPYYFGDEPHLLDCVAFAHISQFVYIPFGGIKEYMESDCGNLLTHLERMKNRYWPDWEEACTNLDLNSHLPKPVADEEIKKTPPEDTEEKKAEPEEEKMEEKEPEDKKPVEDEKPQEIKAEQPVATPEEKKD